MGIEINHTQAPSGSIEHYKHYRTEWERLNALLSTTPIKDRSELAYELDGITMILEEYEDLS